MPVGIKKMIGLMSKSLGYRSLYFFPDVAFKKSKNFFPLKTFISQPLWNANSHGPLRLRDEGF